MSNQSGEKNATEKIVPTEERARLILERISEKINVRELSNNPGVATASGYDWIISADIEDEKDIEILNYISQKGWTEIEPRPSVIDLVILDVYAIHDASKYDRCEKCGHSYSSDEEDLLDRFEVVCKDHLTHDEAVEKFEQEIADIIIEDFNENEKDILNKIINYLELE